jgi:hypothetical protein
MIHQNQPTNKGSLKVQARLELPMAKTCDDAQNHVARDSCGRIKTSNKAAETSLAQVTGNCDQINEFIEATREKSTFVYGRGEMGHSRLYIDRSRLSGEFGCLHNIADEGTDVLIGCR